MTQDPITAQETDDTEQITQLMEETGVRQIPVIKKTKKGDKKAIGLITLDDLIASKLIGLDRLSRIIRAQIAKRRIRREEALSAWRAESRSEARREQTLNHFYNVISKRTGFGPSKTVEQLSLILLGSIIKRLNCTGAAHFICQLPSNLQDPLLDLPAGPDRTITARSMVLDVSHYLNVSEASAHAAITNFFLALNELINPTELDHIKNQLPDDLGSFLPNHHPSVYLETHLWKQ
jgi:uncharacterized protein (DUF2267 family)